MTNLTEFQEEQLNKFTTQFSISLTVQDIATVIMSITTEGTIINLEILQAKSILGNTVSEADFNKGLKLAELCNLSQELDEFSIDGNSASFRSITDRCNTIQSELTLAG